MNKNKENLKERLLSQYEKPNLWINNYISYPPVSEEELKHLRDVMLRDQQLKKVDSDRIYNILGTFPTKLRPELIRSSVNQLRNKNPAIPGSGLVSFCAPVLLPNQRRLSNSEQNDNLKETDIPKNSSQTILENLHPQIIKEKFAKQCPLCMRRFSPLINKYFCENCGNQICRECSRQISDSNPIIFCYECLEVAKVYIKTGDWFTQFTSLKSPTPLKINLNPLQSELLSTDESVSSRKSPNQYTRRKTMHSLDFSSKSPKNQIDNNEPAKEPSRYSANQSENHKQLSYNRRSTLTPENFYPNYSLFIGRQSNTKEEIQEENEEEVEEKNEKERLTKIRYSKEIDQQDEDRESNTNLQTTTNFIKHRSELVRSEEQTDKQSKTKQNHSRSHSQSISHIRHHNQNKTNRASKVLSKDLESDADNLATIEAALQGEIEVLIEYDFHLNQLAIMLLSAHNLTADNQKQFGNPYAIIYLQPDQKVNEAKKLRSKGNRNAPVFDQSVCYFVKPSKLREQVVIIELWSKKGINSKIFLGQTQIPLNEFNFDERQKQTYTLGVKQQIQKLNSIISNVGELQVAIRFAISDTQKRLLLVMDETVDLKGTLEIWIKQAKNILIENGFSNINTYVEAVLLNNESPPPIQKTDHMPQTDQPNWNCVLRFAGVRSSDLIYQSVELNLYNFNHDHLPMERIGFVKLDKNNQQTFRYMYGNHSPSELSIWEAVLNKPGQWFESTMIICKPKSNHK